ncbi:MAG: glycosyltransferase family 4 protein [Gammaproteobacteria bacterium]|nr:glycosyltransferase family 4 protein [Gammaproteobacteria bacterium]MDH3535692.1 glycosyltransferase family 4 protein [Gammaproteobacteria bacterium]
MRIAFYAPMKSPEHPNPSGDRRMAQLIMRALDQCGYKVHLASQHRSYDGVGNAAIQTAIRQEGERQASSLLSAYRDKKIARPHIWFTYHLYHKAPDWIGPRVSRALGIPYVIAEASYATKQLGGPWDLGLQASKQAIEMASAVISFNSVDDGCVSPLLKRGLKITRIRPFIDVQPYAAAAKQRTFNRETITARYNIDPELPWLICVAMMRPGDKLSSYRELGAALSRLKNRPWRLLVIGDGSAREQVAAAFASVKGNVHWLGAKSAATLPGIYAACDLYVWPAVNEAFGMALLEAQAAGLPVIAGNVGGVSGVVNAPDCGVLVEPGQPETMATAIAKLLDEPESRQLIAAKAQQYTCEHHGLKTGASSLKRLLQEVTSCLS